VLLFYNPPNLHQHIIWHFWPLKLYLLKIAFIHPQKQLRFTMRRRD